MKEPKVHAPFYFILSDLIDKAAEVESREEMNEIFLKARNLLLGRYGRPGHEDDSLKEKSKYLEKKGVK